MRRMLLAVSNSSTSLAGAIARLHFCAGRRSTFHTMHGFSNVLEAVSTGIAFDGVRCREQLGNGMTSFSGV